MTEETEVKNENLEIDNEENLEHDNPFQSETNEDYIQSFNSLEGTTLIPESDSNFWKTFIKIFSILLLIISICSIPLCVIGTILTNISGRNKSRNEFCKNIV
jgi:hypothetical protein